MLLSFVGCVSVQMSPVKDCSLSLSGTTGSNTKATTACARLTFGLGIAVSPLALCGKGRGLFCASL